MRSTAVLEPITKTKTNIIRVYMFGQIRIQIILIFFILTEFKNIIWVLLLDRIQILFVAHFCLNTNIICLNTNTEII